MGIAVALLVAPTVGTQASQLQGDCHDRTATLKHGLHGEWVQIKSAVIDKGRVKVRVPGDVDLRTARRLQMIEAPSRLPLDFVNDTDLCQCDQVHSKASLVMEPFMWGHYGHTTFDTFAATYATMRESHTLVEDPVIYMNFDQNANEVSSINSAGQVPLDDFYGEMFSTVSSHPIQAWHALVEQSFTSRICFDNLVMGVSRRIGHYRSDLDWPEFDVALMKSFSGFLHRKLPPYRELDLNCKFRVAILDRQSDRRILNIRELSLAVKTHLVTQGVQDYCVDVVDAENLRFSQQYHLFHNTRVLIGVDGTGLLNAAFMKSPCSGCVHVQPFLQDVVDTGKEYEMKAFCTRFAGHWESWHNDNFSSVVWPSNFDPEIINLARTGTKEAHSKLQSLHEGNFVSREPNMYVNVVELMQLVAKVIDATKYSVC